MNDQELAKNILEITPKIMRFIRTEMRAQAKGELTVPQFRVLLKLARETCTHQEVAEWMGIAAPTLTRMIDTLEKRKLVKRIKDKKDKRCTLLSATTLGHQYHQRFKSEAQKHLAEKMKGLAEAKKQEIASSYLILKEIFSS